MRVSILINNYNYGQFLGAAIDSALNQTLPASEVIVVDDGSTDGSAQVIQQYGDQIVPVLKANGGQASAFNEGFAASTGDVICFLDADDTFHPEKLARLVEIFQADDSLGWCFHPLRFVDADFQALPAASYTGPSARFDLRSRLKGGKLGHVLPFASIATSSMCFRRSLLGQLLPMPPEIRITSDDYLKFAAMGLTPGYALVEELSDQRIHGNNAYTHRPEKTLLRAYIALLTAYWLQRNVPQISRFANNIFADGLNRYRACTETRADIDQLINDYLLARSPLDTAVIQCKSVYYALRAAL
ncbi:MAG: glycosyltransferase family 2 protein [Cyanobacteria bacterium P01_A01_bin.105]